MKNIEKIKSFFNKTNELKELKIIKSTKYLGDIGEYICKNIYNLPDNHNQNQKGYDFKDENDITFQVKINNSSEKTNQEVGKPEKYNFLLLLITNNSYLFNSKYDKKKVFILIYKIENSKLLNQEKSNQGYLKNIAKEFLNNETPDKFLDENLKIINMD